MDIYKNIFDIDKFSFAYPDGMMRAAGHIFRMLSGIRSCMSGRESLLSYSENPDVARPLSSDS